MKKFKVYKIIKPATKRDVFNTSLNLAFMRQIAKLRNSNFKNYKERFCKNAGISLEEFETGYLQQDYEVVLENNRFYAKTKSIEDLNLDSFISHEERCKRINGCCVLPNTPKHPDKYKCGGCGEVFVYLYKNKTIYRTTESSAEQYMNLSTPNYDIKNWYKLNYWDKLNYHLKENPYYVRAVSKVPKRYLDLVDVSIYDLLTFIENIDDEFTDGKLLTISIDYCKFISSETPDSMPEGFLTKDYHSKKTVHLDVLSDAVKLQIQDIISRENDNLQKTPDVNKRINFIVGKSIKELGCKDKVKEVRDYIATIITVQ